MSLRVSHTTINATDAYALSVFWAAALGYAENPDDPNESGHEECMIFSPDLRHRILFIEVEDLVADRRTPDGKGWVVLADPEGNTFCVLRSDAERRAMGDPILPGPADIPGVETRPVGSIPILPMGDPASALAWWGRLGFAVEFEHRFAPELPLYVGLRRDMADVRLSQHRGDTTGPGVMYLWVDDVDEVAAEFGVPVDDNPWGRDCQIVDPSANRVRVGTALRASA